MITFYREKVTTQAVFFCVFKKQLLDI